MQCLGFDLDIIETRLGHATQEILDVSVAPLPCVAVGLLVKVQVAEVEDRFVGALQLFVLNEMPVEGPGYGFNHRLAQTHFDETIRSLKVLIDKKTGRYQRRPNVVQMTTRLFLGEIRSQSERIHSSTEQCRQRVLIFPNGKSAEHGAAARTCDLAASGRYRLSQNSDDGKSFLVSRLK